MRRIQAAILLLLFSSTLFANNVELHYCHGALTDVAFLGTTSCACPEYEEAHEPDVEAETSCCPHEKEKEEKKPLKVITNDDDCCETKIVVAESNEILSTQSNSFSDNDIAYPVSVSFLLDQRESQNEPLENGYDPPLLQRDIIIWAQSFLI